MNTIVSSRPKLEDSDNDQPMQKKTGWFIVKERPAGSELSENDSFELIYAGETFTELLIMCLKESNERIKVLRKLTLENRLNQEGVHDAQGPPQEKNDVPRSHLRPLPRDVYAKEKMYKCPHCAKSHPSLMPMAHHLRSHTGKISHDPRLRPTWKLHIIKYQINQILKRHEQVHLRKEPTSASLPELEEETSESSWGLCAVL